mgnify:CR=1 FL=1
MVLMNEMFILIITSILMLILGIYGLSTRRNALKIIISTELLVNAATLNIITFAHYFYPSVIEAQLFALFIITIAAAEAAIGLSIFLALYNVYGTPNVDVASKLREGKQNVY